ncbi:MFS transporter [Flocculibacter collagenilyticus]|uniref:MFS transporter n=1 Tax=Flocculibacter collagenilyticus TaxID=2744479 RepID=UPI0018F63090|nr:MFS transporter [Flocculibacter collagenilyticus]
MRSILVSCWTLLVGMCIVGICVGVQSSLIAIRAEHEGFSTATIGWVMSGYFLGFLLGSIRAPIVIKRVGHIRAFGALASLASISILIHALFIDHFVWFLMRFISGFAFSAIYVVAESWLNDKADNKNRGTLLSIYMVTMFTGVGAGQFLLNVGSPQSFEQFTLVSILISAALIPMLVTATDAPKISSGQKVAFSALTKTAPLGILIAFLSQCSYASIFGMGPVYATRLGMDVNQIAIFIAAFVTGGVLLQWPIGRISDKLDRRVIIAILAALASVTMYYLANLNSENLMHLYLMMALLGACILPLYSLGMAHTNDYLEREQMIGASSALVRVGGTGAVVGAPTVAMVMSYFGNEYYFYTISVFPALICLYALWRITRRKQQHHDGSLLVIAPTTTSDAALSELVKDNSKEK